MENFRKTSNVLRRKTEPLIMFQNPWEKFGQHIWNVQILIKAWMMSVTFTWHWYEYWNPFVKTKLVPLSFIIFCNKLHFFKYFFQYLSIWINLDIPSLFFVNKTFVEKFSKVSRYFKNLEQPLFSYVGWVLLKNIHHRSLPTAGTLLD